MFGECVRLRFALYKAWLAVATLALDFRSPLVVNRNLSFGKSLNLCGHESKISSSMSGAFAQGSRVRKGVNIKSEVMPREELFCNLCGIQFSNKSPDAHHTLIAFANGTQEKPKPPCLKCNFTWGPGSWRE